MTDAVYALTSEIYGVDIGSDVARSLEKLMAEREPVLRAAGTAASGKVRFSERDALLITYGDMLASAEAGGVPPLVRLRRFLERRAAGLFTYVHLLPFYPSSSDGGFSVMDHRAVASELGTWEDIEAFAASFKPAFDLVLNHGSVKGRWFQAFLAGEAGFERWFLTRHQGYDSSAVFRPRTHPLLTPFTKNDGGTVHVWTTFSADQADYDFSNPAVLLEFVAILLEYAERGARMVRLDAIAYLWKEDGKPCLSHPKTHAVVKLLRAIVDALGLDLVLLTETNVPHAENLSYFGNGDEAHLVYNFALPPLVLHAAVSGNAKPLRTWAATLPPPDSGLTFLNFLASHDGIGVTPARGLVSEADLAAVIAAVEARGGLVSYKSTPSGPVPYELNCSYLNAVAPIGADTAVRARAFLSCQAVMLSLAGVPAVYFHSWIGSENWTEGVGKLGHNRAINRERPDERMVEAELSDTDSLRFRIHDGFRRLLEFRAARAAFSPYAPQRVLPASGAVFALIRGGDSGTGSVLCIQNLGGREETLDLPAELARSGSLSLALRPWETRWIEYDKMGIRAEISLS